MRFSFRLEHVLKHRKSTRDLAQKELSVAEMNLQKHLQYVDSLYVRVDETRKEAAGEQAMPGMNVQRIGQLEEFVLSTKHKITEAQSRSRELMQIVEEKREVLIETAKEFRAIELLKEKQQREFQEARRKKEMKALDEIIQMRFKKENVS